MKQKGFTLIEILAATVILLISLAGGATLFKSLYQAEKQLQADRVARSISDSLINTLNSGAAWKNTVEYSANTNLACLNSTNKGSIPCTGAQGGFVVVDASGNPFFDPTIQGFTDASQICQPPNDSTCPYRV